MPAALSNVDCHYNQPFVPAFVLGVAEAAANQISAPEYVVAES
jgi:hypothetical protein